MNTSRKALLGALDLVGLAITKRKHILPILECVHIRSIGVSTFLVATNLDQTIEVNIPSEGSIDVCLPWKNLREFVSKGQVDLISLEVLPAIPKEEATEENPERPHCVHVSCGGLSSYALHLPPDDFPPPERIKNPVNVDFTTGVLADAFRLTAYAQSEDQSRYVLNGVYYEQVPAKKKTSEKYADVFDGNKIKSRTIPATPESTAFIATDGRRIAATMITLDGAPTVTEEVKAIIPTPAVTMLSKIIKKAPGALLLQYRKGKETPEKKDASYEAWPPLARFYFASVTVTTKLVEGNYPNWLQVIPAEFKHFVSVNRLGFIEAIKTTRMKGHSTDCMTFDFYNRVCTLEQNIPDVGKSTGQVAFMGTLGDRRFRIGFNAGFLQEAFESFTSESITINMIDEMSPVSIVSRADGDHKAVIMPMRVS